MLTKEEIIRDCVEHIDTYPEYEIWEILDDFFISHEEFNTAYEREFG